MNNQDWYLNQLGVTQYILRKPTVMKGEASINIADNIRLIVISQSSPSDKIFDDILKAICVKKEDCLILSPAQLFMPLEQLNHVIWFINENLPDSWCSSSSLDEKAIIETTSLSQLASSPNLKRQLWRTLCQYENYFNFNQ
ncbi:DNA polymerase III subunit psi [Orbus sturtevantii]|uniref:DNA polymerase III subunit psi n=1 Tax=Orbus sturtevantii TaxID=3074109 RepID=UPI00370D7DFE